MLDISEIGPQLNRNVIENFKDVCAAVKEGLLTDIIFRT